MTISAKIEAIQNLHATHNIISTLEQSKASIEQLVDEMPDALFIFDIHGRIYRSNLEGCRLLKVGPENYFGLSVEMIFSTDAAQILFNKIQLVSQNPKSFERPHEFELEVQTIDGKVYPYHWAMRPLVPDKFDKISLFVLYGRNLSEIRSFERELSQIYSSIPIGILAVGPGGHVEAHYSRYCEYLLQHERYSGLNNGFTNLDIIELLYEPSFAFMRAAERDAAHLLVKAIGGSEYWFESIRTQLPQLLQRKTLMGELWLRVDYYPVITDRVVQKILLIIENRSDLVRERQERSVWIKRNESAVRRILEIQNSEAQGLQGLCLDIDALIRVLDHALEKTDYNAFHSGVEGLRSASEAAGFLTIKEMVDILIVKLNGEVGKEFFQNRHELMREYSEIRTECLELVRVFNSLNVQGTSAQDFHPRLDTAIYRDITQAIDKNIELLQGKGVDQVVHNLVHLRKHVHRVNYMRLSRLEGFLQDLARAKAAQERKMVKLHFNWDNVLIAPEYARGMRDVLCFLVEKAIAQGIEAPMKRRKAGKPESGHLHIEAMADEHSVLFRLSDDGKGVSVGKIREITKAKAVKLEKNLDEIPDAELLNLVFSSNLILPPKTSHKHAIVDLSGLRRFLEQSGAVDIKLSSQLGVGSRLEFRLNFEADG